MNQTTSASIPKFAKPLGALRRELALLMKDTAQVMGAMAEKMVRGIVTPTSSSK